MIKYRVGGFSRSSKKKEKMCITCKAFKFPKSDECTVFFETTDYFLGRLNKMIRALECLSLLCWCVCLCKACTLNKCTCKEMALDQFTHSHGCAVEVSVCKIQTK